MMGGAAVLAGVGGALGARTWAHYQALADQRPPPSDSDYASLHREQWATNGLFIAAGAAAIGGVVAFVVETRAKGRSVSVQAEGSGLRVVVGF